MTSTSTHNAFTRRAALLLAIAAAVALTACAAQPIPRGADPGDALAAAGTEHTPGVFAGLNSMAIIVREGLEAVLIIGAVLGTLRNTHRDEKYSRWVYAGVLAGIAASGLTWLASRTLIPVTDANREILEGVTNLVAVGVLFYVTNWLFHKAYVVDWTAAIQHEVSRALSAGSALGLAGLAFTVVAREGFETVLFYQALLFSASPAPVLIGFAAGVLALVGAAVAIIALSRRLPVKPLFTATSVLMLGLAFSFAGTGVHALQEAGWVRATALTFVPSHAILADLFGIFPTLETLLAQVAFVAVIGVTFAISRRHWKRRALRLAETQQ